MRTQTFIFISPSVVQGAATATQPRLFPLVSLAFFVSIVFVHNRVGTRQPVAMRRAVHPADNACMCVKGMGEGRFSPGGHLLPMQHCSTALHGG